MIKRWFVPTYLLMLLLLWLTAWIGLFSGARALAVTGLMLATTAPIAFFVQQHALKQQRTEAHPVWVSSLSGLGAVMIMITIYRYGDQHPIWLGGAIAVLAGWMLYLKLFKLPQPPKVQQDSKQDQFD